MNEKLIHAQESDFYDWWEVNQKALPNTSEQLARSIYQSGYRDAIKFLDGEMGLGILE